MTRSNPIVPHQALMGNAPSNLAPGLLQQSYINLIYRWVQNGDYQVSATNFARHSYTRSNRALRKLYMGSSYRRAIGSLLFREQKCFEVVGITFVTISEQLFKTALPSCPHCVVWLGVLGQLRCCLSMTRMC